MKLTRPVCANILLLFSFTFLLFSCAKQGFPTGGPKDTTPPRALGTKPPNESRHFNAREFYIQFDEYVVLKNVDDNVLVSPPMAQKPEFTTKGKGVLVRLKDTLQPNTTYLFQFKEAIADFNEGNPLSSYEYVFSTGGQMDTLMLAGRVAAARNGKPWKETLTVLAYRPGDSVPSLVTRTDKEGRFAFHYISEGNYRLVAVEDKNKNLTVDSTEAVAWDTTLHVAMDSIDSTRLVDMYISAPDRRVQRLLKAEFVGRGHAVISTLLPMQHPHFDGEEPHQWRLRAKGDTLDLWCLNEECDSAVFIFDDEGLSDTLRLRYRAPRRNRTGKGTQSLQPPLMKSLCDGKQAFYDSLMLSFNVPVSATRDTLEAELLSQTDSSVRQVPIALDSGGMMARLATSVHSGEEYRVRIPDSLFVSLYGRTNDSLTFRMTPKDYGILTLHIDNLSGHPLIVEVLDKRDTVVQQKVLAASGDMRFVHLPEGEYRVRAVIDADGDGQWTTGDYMAGRQPEECIYFGKSLQLREKWEMEEQWRVECRKRKDER